jgi:hypothetical protein
MPLHPSDQYFEYSTRHLIQLLLELHTFGIISSHNNSMTTETCNILLQQLHDKIHGICKEYEKSTKMASSSSHRHRHYHRSGGGSGVGGGGGGGSSSSLSYVVRNRHQDDDDNDEESDAIDQSQYIQRRQLLLIRALTIFQTMEFLQDHYNNHPHYHLHTRTETKQRRIPDFIPKPNFRTYNNIFLMLAKTPSAMSSALTTKDNHHNPLFLPIIHFDDHHLCEIYDHLIRKTTSIMEYSTNLVKRM